MPSIRKWKMWRWREIRGKRKIGRRRKERQGSVQWQHVGLEAKVVKWVTKSKDLASVTESFYWCEEERKHLFICTNYASARIREVGRCVVAVTQGSSGSDGGHIRKHAVEWVTMFILKFAINLTINSDIKSMYVSLSSFILHNDRLWWQSHEAAAAEAAEAVREGSMLQDGRPHIYSNSSLI